jgi:hypothetical protein
VVLTDIQMPPDRTGDGLRAAIEIRRTRPEIGVVHPGSAKSGAATDQAPFRAGAGECFATSALVRVGSSRRSRSQPACSEVIGARCSPPILAASKRLGRWRSAAGRQLHACGWMFSGWPDHAPVVGVDSHLEVPNDP